MGSHERRRLGMTAALLTPVFMGMAPIFGRLAINTGLDAFTLAALRTCFAALFLWILYLLFFRNFIYIFPAGLLVTLVVGAVNGFGSLLFYNGLFLLDNASVVQLLQMLYVIFAMLITRFYGAHVSKLSLIRGGLALFAVYLITMASGSHGSVQLMGAGLMVVSALLYALHVVLSQRIMFEMPAPTMALYSLTFMGITVLLARLVYGLILDLPVGPALPIGWLWLAGLTVVTALSRVTLFAGIRNLGAVQTILLNMAEIAVTLIVAFVWLDERMSLIQWVGVAILVTSVFLSRYDQEVRDDVYRPLPKPSPMSGLPADIQKELQSILGSATLEQMGEIPPSEPPSE